MCLNRNSHSYTKVFHSCESLNHSCCIWWYDKKRQFAALRRQHGWHILPHCPLSLIWFQWQWVKPKIHLKAHAFKYELKTTYLPLSKDCENIQSMTMFDVVWARGSNLKSCSNALIHPQHQRDHPLWKCGDMQDMFGYVDHSLYLCHETYV